jgi:hypothetical protein
MVVSLYFDQQHLLLLLLLLSSGTHLLAEGHVGDLKTGNGADTDVEDGEEENADNTAHEDSYETMSAESNTRLELGVIKRTRWEELVLLKQGQVGLGVRGVAGTGDVGVEVALQVGVHVWRVRFIHLVLLRVHDLGRREVVESSVEDSVGIEGCEQRVQVRVGLEQGRFTVVVGGG